MRTLRATPSHRAALAQLMARSPLLRRYGVTRHRAHASLSEGMRERDLILVALEGADVIGLAWVIVTRALDRAAYLKLLLVAEGEQSRGVGAALLDDAERRVGTLGSRHMVLLVTTTNRRARSFYKAHGYRYVGGLPGFVRPRIGESLYVKTLPADSPRPRAAKARVSSRRPGSS
jgi:GNAT superfamily N-acetyltransferase